MKTLTWMWTLAVLVGWRPADAGATAPQEAGKAAIEFAKSAVTVWGADTDLAPVRQPTSVRVSCVACPPAPAPVVITRKQVSKKFHEDYRRASPSEFCGAWRYVAEMLEDREAGEGVYDPGGTVVGTNGRLHISDANTPFNQSPALSATLDNISNNPGPYSVGFEERDEVAPKGVYISANICNHGRCEWAFLMCRLIGSGDHLLCKVDSVGQRRDYVFYWGFDRVQQGYPGLLEQQRIP